jgi:hypothetical protein
MLPHPVCIIPLLQNMKVHTCIKQYLNFNISVMKVDENIKEFDLNRIH